MKKKYIVSLAVIITVLAIVSIYGLRVKEPGSTERNAERAVKEQKKLELLVNMENEAAKDNFESLASVDKDSDYTKMFPKLYTEFAAPKKTEADKKIAYLTFDDGPSENTYEILDILEKEDIKATFFIVGSTVNKEDEDSLRRMVNEGHTIGIHSYSHMCNEIYCSVERFLDDFNTVYEQIYNITGERVNIYRFPWGSNNNYGKKIKDALLDEMERRGFTCYDWNVDSKDSFGKPTGYSILRNIRKDVKKQNHPIILLHDAEQNDLSARILPSVIKLLKDMGYEFDTLDNREPYQFPW